MVYPNLCHQIQYPLTTLTGPPLTIPTQNPQMKLSIAWTFALLLNRSQGSKSKRHFLSALPHLALLTPSPFPSSLSQKQESPILSPIPLCFWTNLPLLICVMTSRAQWLLRNHSMVEQGEGGRPCEPCTLAGKLCEWGPELSVAPDSLFSVTGYLGSFYIRITMSNGRKQCRSSYIIVSVLFAFFRKVPRR